MKAAGEVFPQVSADPVRQDTLCVGREFDSTLGLHSPVFWSKPIAGSEDDHEGDTIRVTAGVTTSARTGVSHSTNVADK